MIVCFFLLFSLIMFFSLLFFSFLFTVALTLIIVTSERELTIIYDSRLVSSSDHMKIADPAPRRSHRDCRDAAGFVPFVYPYAVKPTVTPSGWCQAPCCVLGKLPFPLPHFKNPHPTHENKNPQGPRNRKGY